MSQTSPASTLFYSVLTLLFALLALELGVARAWWHAVRHRAPGVTRGTAVRAVLGRGAHGALAPVLTPTGVAHVARAHRLGRLMRVGVGLLTLVVGAAVLR